jgi:hypothetical protein
MPSLISRLNSMLSRVVARVPVGTNLGLFHLLWRLLSGRLLQSRGAVIPGLADFGLPEAAVRRAWAALAYGRWRTARLLGAWQHRVHAEGHWQAHRPGGYRPVACDLVGCWRPRLPGWATKHYCAPAGKALPAIPLGIAARIGSVGTQRLALPGLFVRTETAEPGEPALQQRLLQQTHALLATDAVLVTDRGFPLAQLHAAGLTRSVRRGPTNFTARRGPPLPPVARDADQPQGPWSVRCHGPIRGARSPRPRPTGGRPGRGAPRRSPGASPRHAGTTWCCPTPPRAPPPFPRWSSMTRALPNPSCCTRPCPSVARTSRRCIGIAGLWRGYRCGPSRCSGPYGSSSLLRPAGSACPNCRYWRVASSRTPLRPSLPCPPGSGIGLPTQRLVGSAGC